MSTTTEALDPRRFAGMSIAEAVEQIVAEGRDEEDAERLAADAEAAEWNGEDR